MELGGKDYSEEGKLEFGTQVKRVYRYYLFNYSPASGSWVLQSHGYSMWTPAVWVLGTSICHEK